MMTHIRTLLHISRPRFWLYLAGTYLVGVAAAVQSVEDLNIIVLLLFGFFLIPANLFLYGINDLADADTDKFNAKKSQKEHLLRTRERRSLTAWVWACAFLSLGVALWFAFTGAWLASILVLVFLALGAGYSASPVRFKARPFWDSASNILYIMPGLIGYAHLTGRLPSLVLIIAFACWTAAMHLFSAIPDIAADTKAKLRTSATALGRHGSLVVCTLLWLFFASVVMSVSWSAFGVLGALLFVYPLIPFGLLFADTRRVEEVYWWFPAVTGILGFFAFWMLVLAHVPLSALFG